MSTLKRHILELYYLRSMAGTRTKAAHYRALKAHTESLREHFVSECMPHPLIVSVRADFS